MSDAGLSNLLTQLIQAILPFLLSFIMQYFGLGGTAGTP